MYVHGARISVAASTADTSASIATKLIAAVNANAALQVVASAGAASTMVLTAKTLGPTGNDINLRSSYYPDDALAAGVTLSTPAMAGSHRGCPRRPPSLEW